MYMITKWKNLKNKTEIIFLACKIKETPIIVKIIRALIILYILSPVDLIPDFTLFFGYLDEIIVLPLSISFCERLIPENILIECKEQATKNSENRKLRKKYSLISVLLILIFVIFFVFIKFFLKK